MSDTDIFTKVKLLAFISSPLAHKLQDYDLLQLPLDTLWVFKWLITFIIWEPKSLHNIINYCINLVPSRGDRNCSSSLDKFWEF